MKLYTEEQLLNTVNAIQSYVEKFGKDGAQPTIKNHLKMLAPIELPSDEEIDAHLEKTHTKAVNPPNVYYRTGFEKGALWMKEQILNQNK